MTGLMSRGFTLTLSRVSNFAILLLSPLFLVRILDIEAFGIYQEFVIYAVLFITICGFSIDASLTYFLPRYPNKELEFLCQNSLLILILSTLCMSLLVLARDLFLRAASYDYVVPLAAYVFCYVNLNWLEYYWIAKRRTDLVLYYSAMRLSLRVTTLLVAAYLTRDVEVIIWSQVGVELIRLVLVAAYLVHVRLVSIAFDTNLALEQVRFSVPVGFATIIQQGSRNLGKLYIGAVLGPAALALYAVGSYLIPLVRVVQSSLSQVVFPELVRIRHDPDRALHLWKRANIVSCVILFPPFVLLAWYSDLFIRFLFTDKYVHAVPVFQIYLFWLLRRCFNADVLLRSKGRAAFMLTGSVISVVINLGLMVVLYRWLGLIGPAIAYISAEIILELYNTYLVKKEFHLDGKALVDWGGVLRVGIGCLSAVPILFIADSLPGPDLFRAVAASIVFVGVAWFVAYRLGISDIGRITTFGLSQLRRLPTFK